MRYEIKYSPSYSMLVVDLEAGEKVTGEAGAMTYMTPNIDVQTRMRERGILGSLGLKLLGGQSFFVNDYVAGDGTGQVGLVAAPVGDIQVLKVEPGRGYIIQKSAYIASTEGVELDVKWEGFTKGLFGQGLFMIKVYGSGDLFINTFGAIDTHKLEAGESSGAGRRPSSAARGSSPTSGGPARSTYRPRTSESSSTGSGHSWRHGFEVGRGSPPNSLGSPR